VLTFSSIKYTGSRTLEREDIKAQDIRAQKHIMSSILEYNKQKLSVLYIFNVDSESGCIRLQSFKVLYSFVLPKFIQLFMKHVSAVDNSLDNADFKDV